MVAPNGKATTVQTLTSEPARAREADPTQQGRMQTVARCRFALSSQSRKTSSRVLVGRRSVLSKVLPNCSFVYIFSSGQRSGPVGRLFPGRDEPCEFRRLVCIVGMSV